MKYDKMKYIVVGVDRRSLNCDGYHYTPKDEVVSNNGRILSRGKYMEDEVGYTGKVLRYGETEYNYPLKGKADVIVGEKHQVYLVFQKMDFAPYLFLECDENYENPKISESYGDYVDMSGEDNSVMVAGLQSSLSGGSNSVLIGGNKSILSAGEGSILIWENKSCYEYIHITAENANKKYCGEVIDGKLIIRCLTE